MNAVDKLRLEVTALREDLAKARERIAVLEARPVYQPPVLTLPAAPTWPLTLPTTTCEKTYGHGVRA